MSATATGLTSQAGLIPGIESLNHGLRGQIWRMVNRAGTSKVGLNRVQWVDIDSNVDSVCGIEH